MQARDSSNKTTHSGSDMMIGVRDANNNAPRIAGSTGSAAVTYGVVSDSTVAHIAIVAKGGDGTIRLTSSGGMILGSTAVGNSSAMSAGLFKGFFTSTFTWTLAAINSSVNAELTFASTTVDVQPGDLLTYNFMPDVGLSTCKIGLAGHRQSTAAASRVTLVIANVSGSSASGTNSGEVRFSWIDLT